MKVGFVQSGGFVGAIKGCEFDTAALTPDMVQEIELLVRGSGISESGEFLSGTARDLQQYEIVIEHGGRKISVVFDDSSIPASARPLLGFLKKHARPKAPDGFLV
jgi:hypothetical protein